MHSCGIDFAKMALCTMDVKISVPLVSLAYNAQNRVKQLSKIGSVAINGKQLDIAAVVAVAKSVHPVLLLGKSRANTIWRYDCLPVVEDSHAVASLSDSLNVMEDSISNQRTLYGAIEERWKRLHYGLTTMQASTQDSAAVLIPAPKTALAFKEHSCRHCRVQFLSMKTKPTLDPTIEACYLIPCRCPGSRRQW